MITAQRYPSPEFEARAAIVVARFPQVAPHIEKLRGFLAKGLEDALTPLEEMEEDQLLLLVHRLVNADKSLARVGL